jgi:acetyl esterase/lipase
VKLYIVKPEKVQGTPPVILFIHGGVWIAGNFENHKRLGPRSGRRHWSGRSLS